jgi:ATP-dependent Clp protease ATP-binding subunit ClpA
MKDSWLMQMERLSTSGWIKDSDLACVSGADTSLQRNCILLLTTSVGSSHLKEPGAVEDVILENILSDIYQTFPAEFLNRLDDIIPFVSFNSLSQDDHTDVCLNDYSVSCRTKICRSYWTTV